MRAGETIQLTAAPPDAEGDPLTGHTLTWASDDETVETVDDAGLVTGVSNGATTSTATSEGHDGTVEVTVCVGVTGSWSGVLNGYPLWRRTPGGQ